MLLVFGRLTLVGGGQWWCAGGEWRLERRARGGIRRKASRPLPYGGGGSSAAARESEANITPRQLPSPILYSSPARRVAAAARRPSPLSTSTRSRLGGVGAGAGRRDDRDAPRRPLTPARARTGSLSATRALSAHESVAPFIHPKSFGFFYGDDLFFFSSTTRKDAKVGKGKNRGPSIEHKRELQFSQSCCAACPQQA